jgi:hypothetical protein
MSGTAAISGGLRRKKDATGATRNSQRLRKGSEKQAVESVARLYTLVCSGSIAPSDAALDLAGKTAY